MSAKDRNINLIEKQRNLTVKQCRSEKKKKDQLQEERKYNGMD